MKTSARRLGLVSIVPVLFLLAAAGCGGSSSSDCSRLCTQLTECATALDTTVGTLIGDDSVNPGNCASECSSNTSECADRSGFFSCVDELACSSVIEVQDGIFACILAHCEVT